MPKKFHVWGDPKMGPTALVSDDKERRFGAPECGDVVLYEFELADVTFTDYLNRIDEDRRWYAALQVYHGFCAGWIVRDTGKRVTTWPL